MLKALREDSSGEIELSGTRSELLRLVRDLRTGQGEIHLSKVENPFPYDSSLSRIEFRKSSGKVKVSSLSEGETLELQGGLESLGLLADNIEGFALEAAEDDHLHVDYFPEHDYLAEGSGSLVVGIEGFVSKES